MDAQLKAKWVEALRSGTYEQSGGVLKDSLGRYCCIGVLGEIQGFNIEAAYPHMRDRETVSLPEEFCAGVPFEMRATLANMNDGEDGFKKHSFAEIADYIEANL